MSFINEKTKIPLALALGLIVTASPAISVFSIARADVAELKNKVSTQDGGLQAVKQDVAVLKEQMRVSQEMLRDIRDDVKALRREKEQ